MINKVTTFLSPNIMEIESFQRFHVVDKQFYYTEWKNSEVIQCNVLHMIYLSLKKNIFSRRQGNDFDVE